MKNPCELGFSCLYKDFTKAKKVCTYSKILWDFDGEIPETFPPISAKCPLMESDSTLYQVLYQLF